MDRRFLRYYEEELQFLRDLGGEFARAHPAVASRLDLDAFACADPYVERLLEGAAFLTARIQLKMDAEFPRFTDHLLDVLYPDFLAPTPSMAMVRLEPDLQAGTLEAGYTVPRGTRLHSRLGPRMPTRCTFTTAHDVTLWPLVIAEARYLTGSGLAAAGVPRGRETQAALRLGLRTALEIPFERLALDRLVLHLQGGRVAHRLFEAVLAGGLGVLAQPPGPEPPWRQALGRDTVRRYGMEDAQALLPCAPEGFQGYRLLREYFSFPERFLFLELSGLQPAVRRCASDRLDLFLLLDRADAELEEVVGPDHIELFATPAINLFERRCDPINVEPHARDQHLVVDRVRPSDHEVHSVLEVVGDGDLDSGGRTFQPFYAGSHRGEGEHAYYVLERRPRLPSAQEARRETPRRLGLRDPGSDAPRTAYRGSDVFLQLVDGREEPWPGEIKRLHVRALVTSRHLPLLMPRPAQESHFTVETGAPIASIVCLGEPTPPRPSLAHGEPARARPNQPFGETAWRLINHLSLNYLSLVDDQDCRGASALREMLRLYADFALPAHAKQVDGLRAVESRPVIDRLHGKGPIAFGRGLEVRLTLEEAHFDGGSAFLMGSVLEQFFRRYVSINAFTRTVIATLERGEIMRWPARTGRRHLL